VLLLLEILVPWLVVVLVTMIVVTYLALRWGRDPFGWLLLSAAMGPIAIIALIGTRHADVERQRRPTVSGAPPVAGSTRIIVGCDGSATGPRIAEYIVRDLSQNANVVLACVLPHEAEPTGSDQARRDCEARVSQMTQATLDVLGSGGVSVRTAVVFGQAGEEIVRLADREQADLIIVGRRGAGLSKALLGSVSDHVVKHAARPVLIVD
jgi:nucleotide-binding universal stress UspA family protein